MERQSRKDKRHVNPLGTDIATTLVFFLVRIGSGGSRGAGAPASPPR
jgi:hypothetical protein